MASVATLAAAGGAAWKALAPYAKPFAKKIAMQSFRGIQRRVQRRRQRRTRRNRRVAPSNRGAVRAPVAVSVPMRPAPAPPMQCNNTEVTTMLQQGINIKDDPKVFNCNVTESSVFPRLSQIVMQYQRCDWQRLVFQYTPSCPTSTAGQICLAFLSDPEADIPTDFYAVQTLKGAVAGSVFAPLNLDVKREDMNPTVVANVIKEDEDPNNPDRFSSCGKLVVATLGVPANVTIGALRTTYNVWLSEPRETPAGGSLAAKIYWPAQSDGYTYDLDDGQVSGTSPVIREDDGVFWKRTRAPLFIIIYSHFAASAPLNSLTYKPLGSTAQVIAPLHNSTLSTSTYRITMWVIPQGLGSIVLKNDLGAALNSTTMYVLAHRLPVD